MEEERKEPDWFPNAKVYHNGSHYIGIPHTTNKRRQRPKSKEKVFVVSEEIENKVGEGAVKTAPCGWRIKPKPSWRSPPAGRRRPCR